MRFKQSKIRYGSKTTPVSHPNFPTLPQTRLTSVYHNFLLWNTTATTDHISATEYQSEDPTTENTQLNNRMTTASKKKVMVIRMSFRQAHTAQTGFSTGFAKFTWHKQGSAPDIRLLRDHYEIPFVNQNNCFTYDWILSCSVRNFKSSIMLATGWTVVRIPAGTRLFSDPNRPDRLWCPLSLLRNGYGSSFLRVKEAGPDINHPPTY
jgi:hypothetical protein